MNGPIAGLARVSRRGDREYNEDYLGFETGAGAVVAVVCDGLGGHARGDLASETFALGVLEHSQCLFKRRVADREGAKALFEEVFAAGRERLKVALAGQGFDPDRSPQTTAVVAVARPDILIVGHIGDSRAYLLRGDEVLWRTRDHSVVQMLVDQGEVHEHDMGAHPDQGRLFKSIGIERAHSPSVACRPAAAAAGQTLLLCTDGLWEHLLPHELASLTRARAAALQPALEELAETAQTRAAGKSDNISALCLHLPRLSFKDRIKRWFS